jgi:hypothetical protein
MGRSGIWQAWACRRICNKRNVERRWVLYLRTKAPQPSAEDPDRQTGFHTRIKSVRFDLQELKK